MTVPARGQSVDPGIYQVCTTANTDYVITVPSDARGVRLWFETSAASAVMIGGRIAFAQDNTAITGITNTGTQLAYQPAVVFEYTFRTPTSTFNRTTRDYQFKSDGYIHVANVTAGAVVRGQWLY